jgi:hypothetical protein
MPCTVSTPPTVVYRDTLSHFELSSGQLLQNNWKYRELAMNIRNLEVSAID